MRKEPLRNGYIYHICTKSIAGYRIFKSDDDYSRMVAMIRYYSVQNPPMRFSLYEKILRDKAFPALKEIKANRSIVDIIAYCVMPTHLHLLLCQTDENGITVFMRKILDSYSRYFNLKYNRKGPLWQGRFRSILVETDEQLLHLTRYIHLNPTSDGLVSKPEDWLYSSYREYLKETLDGVTNYSPYLNIDPYIYKSFVEDRQDYQIRLAKMKNIVLE